MVGRATALRIRGVDPDPQGWHRRCRPQGSEPRCVRPAAADPYQRYVLRLGQHRLGWSGLLRRGAQQPHPFVQPHLAWFGLALFNLAALLGTLALDLGYNAGNQEYREWPWPIRLLFAAALVVTAYNLVATIARRSTGSIYLSNWYTMGGVLWTVIIASVAILPWHQLSQRSEVRSKPEGAVALDAQAMLSHCVG